MPITIQQHTHIYINSVILCAFPLLYSCASWWYDQKIIIFILHSLLHAITFLFFMLSLCVQKALIFIHVKIKKKKCIKKKIFTRKEERYSQKHIYTWRKKTWGIYKKPVSKILTLCSCAHYDFYFLLMKKKLFFNGRYIIRSLAIFCVCFLNVNHF